MPSCNAEMRIGHLALILALGCYVAGCGSDSRPAPVSPDQARTALTTVLDGWKAKQTMEEVRSATGITVQDDDWANGRRLISYEVKGGGKEQDAHLRCPVELVLADAQGKQTRKNVTYIIGTSPQMTVFREVFPQ